jgi:hypothetical protein
MRARAMPRPTSRRSRRSSPFSAHILETGTQSYRLRTSKATSRKNSS